MQTHELEKHEVRERVHIVPGPDDRKVVQAAQRRLREDPGDPDALFAIAAWHDIVGAQTSAIDLLNRLVSRKPDYPGVWWLRARILKDLGREGDSIASERIARMYAELDDTGCVRKFPL